jgi:hypothetical protein
MDSKLVLVVMGDGGVELLRKIFGQSRVNSVPEYDQHHHKQTAEQPNNSIHFMVKLLNMISECYRLPPSPLS